MQSQAESAGDPSTWLRASSCEKPRGNQEYALDNFHHEGGNRDQATDTARESDGFADYDEPLLPPDARDMEAGPGSPSSRRHDPRFSCSPSGICAWLRGPTPPHVYHINPWFPKWQSAPARMIDRWLPRRNAKIALLLCGLVFWMTVFFSALKASMADQEVPGYGQPIKLSCHSRLWSKATNCGLDGYLCRPFDKEGFAFRCPAGCAAAMILEPYTVGDQDINYRPLVIGGKTANGTSRRSGIYRGDSSVCASALHAGLIDDAKGGWGILRRTGESSNFQSVKQNSIESIAFPSYFPMSFMLTRETSSSGSSEANFAEGTDIRWSLFGFTVCVTTILSLTVTSAPVFYSVIYFIVWFQVAMSSDPPSSPTYYELVSTALGRFLPGAFIGFVMYYFCVRHTLRNLDAHWDKTVLWLGGCWVGALNTDTFDRIPISRLTPHDLQQQPGAVTALIVIIGALVIIAISQALAFRREGRFFTQLRVYALLVTVVLILLAVPNMNLRIHHYILALLLLPGTTLQTRPSLLYQGILVGLFINGIARWGFDPILQTSSVLLAGARLGTNPPNIDPPDQVNNGSLVFSFPDLAARADGISVLVNDVERFHTFRPRDGGVLDDFTWSRLHENETEYFRFGYIRLKALGGVWHEDFSDAAVWMPNGSWVPPPDRKVDGVNSTMRAFPAHI